eukprot:CAMPEP_0195023848 /NCGR_PEP_ID=MMETSP0326_2-20130528/43859_1 /TAXON_ID=2866 ORGANISM="Crypthecodinium cohnii, Strain Seligo" /NCGR_SAMPLE_ID=MMETSP0326_2 /ASSEMBLY_ACC=CAM_ASM_000348 /LENGTH=95 /DNA_ID=CAMNT_0040044347 /DNA_START=1 /DNA_END=285 /DNA_ORIENTATION=+
MKAGLAVMLRNFKFELAVPREEIKMDSALTIGMSSGLPAASPSEDRIEQECVRHLFMYNSSAAAVPSLRIEGPRHKPIHQRAENPRGELTRMALV